jgi:hypothetical protein
MDGYKDICFQLHLVGGTRIEQQETLPVSVEVWFEGCNDLDDGTGLAWVVLGSGYSQANDTTQDTWVSTGATALDDLVDFDNFCHRRIRMVYEFDGAPDEDLGMVIATTRRKAL